MVRVGLPERYEQSYGALRRPWHVYGPVVHDVLGCVYLANHPPDGDLKYMGFPDVPITAEHKEWLDFLLCDPRVAADTQGAYMRWSRQEHERLQKLIEWRQSEGARCRREPRQGEVVPEYMQLTHRQEPPWVHLVVRYLRLKRVRTLWSYLGKHLQDVKAIGKQVNEEEDAKQEAREAWKHLVTRYMQNEGSWEREEDDSRSHPQQGKGKGKDHCWFYQNHRSTQCKGAAKGKGKSKARPSHRG